MNRIHSVLFLTATNDPFAEKASTYLRSKFQNCQIYCSEWGQKFPEELESWTGDYIISFLSRWIIPQKILTLAKRECLNFHPGPPEYPGIGCTNFAIYERASQFGVTCHRMESKVDTGDIISTKKFPIDANETIENLHNKTRHALLTLFIDIIQKLSENKSLTSSPENWTREPFTRHQLNELAQICFSMTADEVNRRIRATSFKNWQPYIEFHGFRFDYKP